MMHNFHLPEPLKVSDVNQVRSKLTQPGGEYVKVADL